MNYGKIVEILKEERSRLENEVGFKGQSDHYLIAGKCIKYSERIKDRLLKELNLSAELIEGWVLFEKNFEACSDRIYDGHTWLECEGLYIDITLDQFTPFLDFQVEKIYAISTNIKPECLYYYEPVEEAEYLWGD